MTGSALEEEGIRMPRGRISVGCLCEPRVARETLRGEPLVDHLALEGPPREDDLLPAGPHRSFTLLPRGLIGRLAGPFDAAAVSGARETIARCRAARVAERLAASAVTGHTRAIEAELPPLYTVDLLDELIAGARALREALGVPLAVEPLPTWLRLDLPRLPEGEFLRRLLEASGCDLLLDIPAAILTARAAGRDPREFVAEMPLQRAVEIQVAGLRWDPILEDDWIGPDPPGTEILDLMIFAAGRAPRLEAVTFGGRGLAPSAPARRQALGDIRDRLGIREEAP